MSGIKNRDFTFDPNSDALFQAIMSLQSIEECEKFFRDVLTVSELQAMTERYTVARKLFAQTQTYRQINKETGVSTATITRVADWLKNGMGGYRLVLERFANNSHHHTANT